jgi:SHS2 domain-containing protein
VTPGPALASAIGSTARRPDYWEHFPHGADVGIRGVGATMAEAFAQAALALTAAVCDVKSVRPLRVSDIVCRAPSPELLLVDWLNAIIFAMATEHMIFSAFEVRIEDRELHAMLKGEPIDRDRHQPAVEVKGATHTALRVEQRSDTQWIAQCVIDV